MKILNFEDLMKENKLKNDTRNESNLQRVYNFRIYPRDSQLYSDGGFVNIDDGSQGGSHWCCFTMQDKKSYYFDSFVGQPDKFLLNQLPKPILYHNYKIQDINSKICGPYCLCFFYLIERTNFYDAFVKMYFG